MYEGFVRLHIMVVCYLYRASLRGSAKRTAREESPIDDGNSFGAFLFEVSMASGSFS